ncbi:reverse transcriptase domain-containing protein [Paludisphaera sp.]|uniref:reverse transcriptase domain-containing protein n=1 Tax=Paludisphaera sp. TaxID=2017432 RepID=UPI00301D0CE2
MTPAERLAGLFSGRRHVVWEGMHREFLAGLLGVETSELDAIRMGSRYYYRPIAAAKPDGRERRILAPSPALKTLQRRFLDAQLAHNQVHPAATAFRPGGSTLAHVLPHARNRTIAAVDLRDFFESTRGSRVARWLAAEGWAPDTRRILMRLCVFRDGLPQGAPTSPCLSNLVNYRLDERIETLTGRTGGVYTRYGDDLAFSWPDSAPPGGFTAAVEDILARSGYEVQPRKGWRVGTARDGFELVGLTVHGDGRIRVPRSSRWRATLLRWNARLGGDAAVAARARGLDAYIKMVDRMSRFR